jgi:hypothetical protein
MIVDGEIGLEDKKIFILNYSTNILAYETI